MFAGDQRAMGLLLAAHGERNEGGVNDAAVRLAASVRSRGVVAEVAIGFIRGQPGIGDGMRVLRCREVIVYPLFLSAGYFTRVRLPQLLEGLLIEEPDRRIHMLPPLGLEPSLAGVIARSLVATARRYALAPKKACAVLLAHGSTTDPASRMAAERIAAKVQRRGLFANVRVALLEESPTLAEAVSHLSAPILVFGLFAGDGLHGGADAPRLVEQLGRADVIFAGTLANLDATGDIVAGAVARTIVSRQCGARGRRRKSSCATAPAPATAMP